MLSKVSKFFGAIFVVAISFVFLGVFADSASALVVHGPGYQRSPDPEGIYINKKFRMDFSGAYKITVDGASVNAYCLEAEEPSPHQENQVLQSNIHVMPEFDYLLYKYGETDDRDRATAMKMLGYYYTQQMNSVLGQLIWSDSDNGYAPIDPNSSAFTLSITPFPETDLTTARTMARDMFNEAAQMTGPWTITVDIDDSWAGGAATATITLRSSTGAAIPNATVNLTYTNATGPATVTTNASGNASITLTPNDELSAFSVQARTSAPGVHREFRGAPSTQRTAVRGVATTVNDTDSHNGLSSDPQITTNASTSQLFTGGSITDSVTLSGVDSGLEGTINVAAYGPYDSIEDITAEACSADDRVWTSSEITTNGSGTFTTNAFTPTKSGYYTFKAVWEGQGGPATHPCGQNTETFQVYEPTLATQASDKVIAIGGTITDTVTLSGVPDDVTGKITVNLYGPKEDDDKYVCSQGTFVDQKVIETKGGGEFVTPDFKVDKLGEYTFVATWKADDYDISVSHNCGMETESFAVTTNGLLGTPDTPEVPDTGFMEVVNSLGLVGTSVVACGLVLSSSMAYGWIRRRG